jgi:hypothetical protein
MENITLIVTIVNYPKELYSVALIACICKYLKLTTLYINQLLIIIFILYNVIKKFTAKSQR